MIAPATQPIRSSSLAPGYRSGEEGSSGSFSYFCHTPGLPVSILGQIVPVVFPSFLLREGGADTETDNGRPACRKSHPRHTPVLQPRPVARRG